MGMSLLQVGVVAARATEEPWQRLPTTPEKNLESAFLKVIDSEAQVTPSTGYGNMLPRINSGVS